MINGQNYLNVLSSISCEKFSIFPVGVVRDYVWVESHVIHKYGVAQYVFNNLLSIAPHQTDWVSHLATRNFKCCALPGRTTRQGIHSTKQLGC